MARRCWTCQNEHDLDDPCPANSTVRSMRSYGSPGNELFDATTPDLFDAVEPDQREISRVEAFRARYRSECPECWEWIDPGDMIVGSGNGYVHEECALKEEDE